MRDAVARAQRSLPDEADDPIVYKNNGSGEASLYINLSSSEMDRTQLTDYAERVLMDRFSLITECEFYRSLWWFVQSHVRKTQTRAYGWSCGHGIGYYIGFA